MELHWFVVDGKMFRSQPNRGDGAHQIGFNADDLKGIASARKAVVGLRREINVNDIRVRRESITLADLSRHFQQRELVGGNTRVAYSTRKAYEGYLRKWIEPRWGEYRLFEIRAVEVESWLKSLNRAPGTRCKIRNVMGLLFNHGRRHDLCDRNPIPIRP